MITLVKTTREVRLILKWTTIVLGTLTCVILLTRFVLFLNTILFPTPPPPPEQGFGSLPILAFNDSRLKDLNYRINTTTGFLPTLPKEIKIYKVRELKKFILTVYPVREKLTTVHFTRNEKKMDEITYSWTNARFPNKKITYNILTNDFDIEYEYKQDNDVLFTKFTDPKKEALGAITNFLSGIEEDIEDLDLENAKVTFYRIEDSNLVTVERGQNPQIVYIKLWHKKLEDIPIVYEQEASPMEFIVGSGKFPNQAHIVEAHYKHRRIDPARFSNYPVKITQSAFDELQNGKAVVLKFPSGNKNIKELEITNVYLAYYFPSDAEYLRPIIVFESKDFKAFTDGLLQAPIIPTKAPN